MPSLVGRQEFATDLERWRAGFPISARPVSLTERAFKWARRQPIIASLITSIVVVSLILSAGIWWQWRDTIQAREEEEHQRKLAESALNEKSIQLNDTLLDRSEVGDPRDGAVRGDGRSSWRSRRFRARTLGVDRGQLACR